MDAKDAVAALIRRYRAEQEQRSASGARLSQQAQTIFDSVLPMCEWRLGRPVSPETALGTELTHPNTVDEILLCLKKIQNSIDFWTKRNGRQGYLSFVAQYV